MLPNKSGLQRPHQCAPNKCQQFAYVSYVQNTLNKLVSACALLNSLVGLGLINGEGGGSKAIVFIDGVESKYTSLKWDGFMALP